MALSHYQRSVLQALAELNDGESNCALGLRCTTRTINSLKDKAFVAKIGKGHIYFGPTTGQYAITAAGRAALEQDNKKQGE